jgi:hypothetical protein
MVTLATDWSLSGGTVAWNKVSYRYNLFASRITLQDLATGRETPVVVTPYFTQTDPHAWGVKGVSLSGNRVVWTRTTAHSANVMLYDRRTRRTVALTHDNISLVGRIYGDTVAWLTNQRLIPEGTVHIRDLRTGRTAIMPAIGYNVSIGNGLVSWFAVGLPHTGVPIYFVRRHALRFCWPTAAEQAQGGHITDVRIFGRTVLVPTILHFENGLRWQPLFRLDIY